MNKIAHIVSLFSAGYKLLYEPLYLCTQKIFCEIEDFRLFRALKITKIKFQILNLKQTRRVSNVRWHIRFRPHPSTILA